MTNEIVDANIFESLPCLRIRVWLYRLTISITTLNKMSEVLTLWDCEKCQKGYGIAMGTPHRITNVAKRNIQGVVVVLAGRNRNCSLITSKDDWCKHRTVG